MADEPTPTPRSETPEQPAPKPARGGNLRFVLTMAITAAVTIGVTALLITIFQHKQEQKNPFVRVVDVDEITTDPIPWGRNWPREYDSYQRTVDVTRTRFGGSEALPAQKLEKDPWLREVFAGYAFSIDYRDRRGHAYMLSDQVKTERINQKPQPGACLNCHSSIIPTYRRVGLEAMGQPADDKALASAFDWPAVQKGFEIMSTMPYVKAHAELLKTYDGTPGQNRTAGNNTALPSTQPGATTREALASHQGQAHPVSCIDCHDPKTMQIRVTRPAFVKGIQALANSTEPVRHLPSIERWRQGGKKQAYDPNADATRQEMRSFVCAQCHVEYYCGPKETLLFPWGKGLRVEQIESYYDEHKFPSGEQFNDWKHQMTGAPVYKAQHPEFEMWSQGIHAQSGVACADCHMPYVREGALKVSDHWVRSPMLMVNRSCQVCHNRPEDELKARVDRIQERTHDLIERGGAAASEMIRTIAAAKQAGITGDDLQKLYKLQRQAQWRLDFVYAENSMGFHASQETARILAESIDYSRQAVILAQRLSPGATTRPTTQGAPTGLTPGTMGR